MDPHIRSEQPGLSPDAGKGDEGVNYLRRLKGTPAEGVQASAPITKGGGPATATSVDWIEKRQSPRIRCSGSAEFRVAGNDVRMWGTLTDISLHGCYVEMNSTFPVDTKVDLVLKSFGIRIHTAGTVRATYPFLGMGIRFEEIEPGEQLQLKQLLEALSGHSAVSNRVSVQEDNMKDVVDSANAGAFLDEVTKFFQQNQLLSRAEFYKIAKRVRRS